MRMTNVSAMLLWTAMVAISGCDDPYSEKLKQAENLLNQGKATEALRLALEVKESDKHRDTASSLLSKISDHYLVILTNTPSIKVYLSPAATLGELPKESDPKTPLAKSFGETGVPRTVGCKDFLAGVAPLALPKPDTESVIAVLYRQAEGESVAATRAFDGAIEIRGKPSFEITAMGGFAPRDAAIILWDDAKKKSGQIQMLSSGELVAVSVFWHSEDRKSPVSVKLAPEDLYESLAGKSLSLH